MIVKVRYLAQVRHAAGVGEEEVEWPGPGSLQEIVIERARARGEALQRLLLDSTGALQSTILLFVGEEQVERGQDRPLQDGDIVTVLAPMAGG
jgi:molybdopterin converting factor small subunit